MLTNKHSHNMELAGTIHEDEDTQQSEIAYHYTRATVGYSIYVKNP